jgi:signal-transduction protein with cAMP-binding, CBS, and nucleotidyltransferase domain
MRSLGAAERVTGRHRSRWLEGFIGNDTLAAEYVKAHGGKVSDVMTRKVITASPQTPLHEVATLMEKNGIKRAPILANVQLVGIVSRANLIQVVATARKLLDIPLSDTTIWEKILSHLKKQPWAHTTMLKVTVNAGVVDLWGIAESTLGVCAANDNLITWSVGGWE